MSRGSSARQHRRAMAKAGVAVAVREVVVEGHSSAHSIRIQQAVSRALTQLEVEGGDMTSRIAITIGNDHPSFPGKTIVEAKAAAMKVVEANDASHVEKIDERLDRLSILTDEGVVDPDRDDAGS